ncbi:MAG: T9SS type A sorting domain-containing protein [Bacteroidetes bacterium]|nr:T9SS type A sorting domain-containing protein [Bacteroidota bacterium]
MKKLLFIFVLLSYVSITNAQWVSLTSGTTNNLFGVHFNNIGRGIAVGANGTILRTTDGGTTWVSQTSGTTKFLLGVSFTDANFGTVVGSGRIRLKTVDGGTTWVPQFHVLNILYGVSFTDADNGTAVGSGGIILRTSSVVTAIDDNQIKQPNSFILMQNYPNPFNPSTTIQYVIISRQFVSLKVYDILGREVATLVNEEKPIGSYRINFNGSKLTSGVYFYRLRAGSFTQTKKFVLLR